MEIKIDDNVPFPESTRNGQKRVLPDRELEVGQSFFLEGVSSSAKTRAGLFNSRNPGKRFRGAKVTENGVEGFRYWRLS